MVRANWSRVASRNRMRRQGVEDRKDKIPVGSEPPKQLRGKLSKAELREQAAAAFLAWRAGQHPKTSRAIGALCDLSMSALCQKQTLARLLDVCARILVQSMPIDENYTPAPGMKQRIRVVPSRS